MPVSIDPYVLSRKAGVAVSGDLFLLKLFWASVNILQLQEILTYYTLMFVFFCLKKKTTEMILVCTSVHHV
jgi:hypothetical protein